MRIVAGTLGGRTLLGPPTEKTRPTTDKVREAMFNALGSAGGVDGARIVDLFAGTGALGIEALSRGAAHVTFVEKDRRTASVLQQNLDTLGIEGSTTRVVVGDALTFSWPGEIDLALIDPPYAFTEWSEVLDRAVGDRLVCESSKPIPALPGWSVVRERKYGTTRVTFLERSVL